jgi:hypothetical protein
MAKYTLLEMTQRILSNMDSDEVNSISDTIESEQVAEVVRQAYFDLVDEHDLPSNGDLVNLTGLGNTAKPTHMLIPESTLQVKWIKYDCRQETTDPISYKDIKYLDPKDFIELCNSRDSTDTTNNKVVQYNADTPIVISKIAGPTHWTSIDDEYIVMDSYDSDVDTTLQSSKCMSFGYTRPEFILADTTIPDLPENLFTYLLAKAEATCFSNFKQMVNPKAEQREGRMRIRSQRNKWREARMLNEGYNFGRK